MANFELAVFIALIFINMIYCQEGDPCTNHKVINDVYRSTKYQMQSGFAAKCDDQLTTGWYRFKSIVGEKMPETKPSPNHCGTVAPIWIRDTHPTAKGQQKDVTACINIRDMMDGCLLKETISVKNCDDFYVYKLKRIRGCPAAYCAGNKMPCPKGQVGLVPNCSVSIITPFPSNLLPTPTITYRTPVDPLTMLCKFNFPNWKNVSFGIEWFNDGYSVKTETICNDKSENDCLKRYSELPALHPDQIRSYFKPGHRVHCKLRMRYNTNADNNWTSIATQSNQYFIGIKVVASHQNGRLQECNKETRITVTFTPTVPILDVNEEHLSIKILVPIQHTTQASSKAETCDLKLPHGMLPSAMRSIVISPVCDNVNQLAGSMDYHFVINDFFQTFWFQYKLPSVRIIIDNTPQQECAATGDPHYRTFDGRYYDFMPIGDYVLYKNTLTDTEVHARSWICWNHVTCNCGVAIREGADIIILSVCNSNLIKEARLLKTEIRSERGLAPGTHIIKTLPGGRVTYNVVLPSGNRVKVERYDWGMNIFVKAMSPKPNTIFGLCGNFNGNPNDEYHHGGDNQQHGDPVSFGKSWRVEPNKSNFNLRLSAPTLPTAEIRYCECPPQASQDWNCDWTPNDFKDYNTKSGQDIAKDLIRNNRRRRSITGTFYSDDIMDYEDRSFFVDEKEAQFALSRIRSRRSVVKNVMSIENATRHCKAVIEDSTAGKTCSDVPGFNVTSAMAECITDLKFTGDMKFAGAAFDSMKESCEEVALKNISLYQEDASGKLQPPEKIGNNLCPGDCSGHGKCLNRTCICEKDYTSDDCSMSIKAVPELLGIYDGGLCDIRKRPCKKTDIFGKDFINSENITCHIREFKVISSNWVPKQYAIKKRGDMIDIFGVRCDLPDPPTKLRDYNNVGTPAGGLWISISNDGQRDSQRRMRFISYDSVCMVCNKTGNCSFKENSCLIRGHCFAANETNPRDWCQQCMPGSDEYSWTRRKVNHPPAFAKGQSSHYAVVGEILPLQIKATDPDKRPVTYSLVNTTADSGYTLSPTGFLRLNVTSKKNQDFVIQATDECNATDTMTVTVRIVVCPCKNNVECSPHPYHPRGSGLYSCKCPTGLTGDRCEINIDDCISVNCGNGTCIDGINNYTCKCNVGFEGPSCDQKTHNCTKQSCFAGVQCTETSSGISCGPCPNGMSGDGKTCTLVSTSTPAYTSRSTFVVASREISSTSFITPEPTSTFVGPEPSASSSFAVPDSRSTSSFASSVVHTPTVTYSSPESRSTSSVSSELKVNITSVSAVPESRPTSSIVTSKVTSASQEISSTTATMPPAISPSKTKTATAPTSSVDKVTEYIVSAVLRINREWDNAFLDNELEKFKILASEVEQEIFKAYSRSTNGGLKTVKVISFRRGSIIVEFELTFRKKQSDPLLPLKESLKDGKLGTIEVYPESLKEKNKDSEKPTKAPTKPNLTLILVLAGVGFVIFIFAVVVLYMCRNPLKRRVYQLRKKRQSSKVIIEEDDQDCKDNVEMSREFHHGAPLPKKVGLDMEAGSTNAGYHD